MSKHRQPTRREVLAAAGSAVVGSAALVIGQPRVFGQDTSSQPAGHRAILDEVDVLVVGGGPAGIGAALGAARKGAKTLLIENHSFFGGVAAWALGMPIN